LSRIVLDAYAVLALLGNEAGSEVVERYMTDADTEIYLSVISLGEIYYILLRRKGTEAAEELVRNILTDESLAVIEAPWQRVKGAAFIKAKGGLSYADSFVVDLALELEAVLVTGDPEILSVSGNVGVKVAWLES
jgi:predicted nucleic acid-binding protein